MDSTNIQNTDFDNNFDQLDSNFETLTLEIDTNSYSKYKNMKLQNMELMSRMITSMKIQHPSKHQLMPMNQDEDSTIPITGKMCRPPEGDGSHMNTTAPKINKTNQDTTIGRHRSPPKITNG